MILYITKNITTPFPYTRGFIPEIISTFKVCLLATLIFFFFKPFGLEQVASSIILGFGLVVFLSALFNIAVSLYVIRRLVDEDKWSVWKEVIRSLAYLCINIIAIILFAEYNLDIKLSVLTTFKFIGYTIFIAIIPLSIRVVSINNWLLKNKLKEAQRLSDILKNRKHENESIVIELRSNIVNDIIKTTNNELQFIEADKNYITVTELKENEPKNSLLRLSIIKALEQIEDENIIRCHRSYVVNLKAVKSVTGNSQGLKLLLSDSLKQIPVSRSYKKVVKEKLSSLV